MDFGDRIHVPRPAAQCSGWARGALQTAGCQEVSELRFMREAVSFPVLGASVSAHQPESPEVLTHF